MASQSSRGHDVIVVGGGQAGLAASHVLARDGIDHMVLERGEIGESWRSQRWDSFCLNTPNWCNALPGREFLPDAPDAFAHRDELVGYLEGYASASGLPVQTRTRVTSVEEAAGGGYTVRTDRGAVAGRAVILASGSMSRPRVPAVARGLPADVTSHSAGSYRNPEALPPGAVLVIGSGQSGCQIAEDLLGAGRSVFVSASKVARIPRTYRGRDVLAWWKDMGFLEVALDELEDPAVQFATQPHVSGTDGGHTVSLQSLARDGATLLGRVSGIRDGILELANDLEESIAFADEKARTFRADMDAHIERAGVHAPDPEPDPGEPPLPDLHGSDAWKALDLRSAGVTSVVWCTGFDADWSWVKADVFDERGRPRHRQGVTESDGLYFLGFPWLSKRKSGILYGVGEDAERVVRHLRHEVLGD